MSKYYYDVDYTRNQYLQRKYGITTEVYKEMLALQGGVCWICCIITKKGANPLAVDHIHSIDENKRNDKEKRASIRGLLCVHCNHAIEKYRHDSEWYESMMAYDRDQIAQRFLEGILDEAELAGE